MANHILSIAIVSLLMTSVHAREIRVDSYGDTIPNGAAMRFGTIRFRYEGFDKQIKSVPHTSTFLVGNPSQPLRLFDANTGKVIRELAVAGNRLIGFDVSSDGQTVYVFVARQQERGPDFFAELSAWDLELRNRRVLGEWSISVLNGLLPMAVSRDGTKIACANRGGMIRVWDAQTGSELGKRLVVEHEVEDIDLSPDGTMVAVASRNGVYVCDWSNRAHPAALMGLPRGAKTVAYSPDGKWLATGSGDSIGARLYDAKTNQLVRRFQGGGSRYYPEGMTFDAESKLLVVPTYEEGVEVWDVGTGALKKMLSANGLKMSDAVISSDGRFVAAAAATGPTIQVWDLKNGTSIADEYNGHQNAPYEIAFSSGGKTMLSSDTTGTTYVWSLESGKPLYKRQQDGWVAALAISPDGRFDVSSGHDEIIRVWESKSNRLVFKLMGHGRLGGKYKLAFAPDGKTFASFGPDMYLRTWDIRTGKALTDDLIRVDGLKIKLDDNQEVEPEDHDPFKEDTMSASRRSEFSPDAKHLLVPLGSKLNIFEVATGEPLKSMDVLFPSSDFCVSPNGDRILNALGSRFRIIDVNTGETVIESEAAGKSLRQPRFSLDGQLISLNAYDRESRSTATVVWNAVTGDEYARLPCSSTETAFLPGGNQVATALRDGTIVIWDLREFRVGK